MGFEFPQDPARIARIHEEEKGAGIQYPNERGPHLRFVKNAFELLRPEKNELGEEVNWRHLAERVEPYTTGLELSDNIREIVKDYVECKIPVIKEKIPSINDLPDRELLEALSHNWFDVIEDDVGGQRREILLMVMAHIVRRIETKTYQEHLKNPNANLEALGLTPELRDLLVDVMDASVKANPLFIRFIAYTRLAPPEKGASSEGITFPGNSQTQTIASLFPHETQFISKRFHGIAERGGAWESIPGGDAFKKYIALLGDYYAEQDAERAEGIRRESELLYRELLEKGFPILVTSATEGQYCEPYLDPELKISVATPDSRKEEGIFQKVRDAMAESLEEVGMEKFENDMKKRTIRSTHAVGSYGVNVSFNAVAQENPVILLFLNEQMRVYDRNFHKSLSRVTTAEPTTEQSPEEKERMSRMMTILHECSHVVYLDGCPESKRLGDATLTKVDEIKAETLFRALIPSVIERGGLEGTKAQWARGILASSLQALEDGSDENDPYFLNQTFSLNRLFESGVVSWSNGKLALKDVDQFYEVMRSAAKEVIALYEDPAMTGRKAAKWIRECCKPIPEVQKVIETLVSGKEN